MKSPMNHRTMFHAGLLFFFAAAIAVQAAEPVLVRSRQSGAWSNAATWEGGQKPKAGSQILIREGHRVLYDVDSKDVLRLVQIAGTLEFSRDQDTRLEVGLIKIAADEKVSEEGFDCAHATGSLPDGKSRPALLVGTSEQPIPSSRKALVRLHYLPGMNEKSCPAIVCCGGRMDFHGAPLSRTWVRLDRTAASGSSEVALQEAVEGWKEGDLVLVTGTKRRGGFGGARTDSAGQTEERRIVKVSKAEGAAQTVQLDSPLKNEHFAEGNYRGEIANLSRNVVVESADPNGVRGHTMYHRHSAGSISYAEFRHLGKRDLLGRYSLHYHLVGDTMRGSSVIGASIWGSHNHWLTIHGTNYLVVRDCVGYKSVGHGFFLEDATEVYNVLDRNLAVQALAGKPLPEQIVPFDDNKGAGFWWANCQNSFTNNVAVECKEYGFRFDNKRAEKFNPVLKIMQPDGSTKLQDTRLLPFVRFENNEAHTQENGGLNLRGMNRLGFNFSFPELNETLVKEASDAHPDYRYPYYIRNFRCWEAEWAFHAGTSAVLMDGLDVNRCRYGVWRSVIDRHTYRNTSYKEIGHRDMHMPFSLPIPKDKDGKGYDKDYFRGIARFFDEMPPTTVITHVARHKGQLVVRGTTSDASTVRSVKVNGKEAVSIRNNFLEWQATLDEPTTPSMEITAHAEDSIGHKEPRPHRVKWDK